MYPNKAGPLHALLAMGMGTLAAAQTPAPAQDDFAWMDLEQLSHVRIVSASKREQALQNIPAAITALGKDDLQSAPGFRIPTLLQTVPGLNTAQINSSTWAISARGFQWQFGPRMLVMMDGRSIYTPLYGGVMWDVQDYLFEDLARIEVVLGPGGSIWGSNAMNGIINILSKPARETQGSLLEAGLGSRNQSLVAARQGFRIAEGTYGRVYAKHSETAESYLPSGDDAGDSHILTQTGFRSDGGRTESTTWTLQGDAYKGSSWTEIDLPSISAPPSFIETVRDQIHTRGANLLGRSLTALGDSGKLSLQGYFDYTDREGRFLDYTVRTWDLEAQSTFLHGRDNKLDVGVGLRYSDSHNGDSYLTLLPPDQVFKVFNAFIQEEWWLAGDKVCLTAGLKLEHNSCTGLEPEPALRLLWKPTPAASLWAGISQASRLPSSFEYAGYSDLKVLPPGALHAQLPGILRIEGYPGQDENHGELSAEHLTAFEIGSRLALSEHLSLEANLFYYDYSDLVMLNTGAPYPETQPVPAVVLPLFYRNSLHGENYGGELSVTCEVNNRLRVRAGLSVVHIQLHTSVYDPIDYEGDEYTTPRHQAFIDLGFKPAPSVQGSLTLRYADSIGYYRVPASTNLDARLSWQASPEIELTLVGQNLLEASHPEQKPALIPQSYEIPRGFFLKATWKY